MEIVGSLGCEGRLGTGRCGEPRPPLESFGAVERPGAHDAPFRHIEGASPSLVLGGGDEADLQGPKPA